ncbi:MAG: DUF3459 domain-containing protein, partial [Actinomycetota bacterium]|nr:DUF3459 domain-containing protein [Actinomycetota bacterium]
LPIGDAAARNVGDQRADPGSVLHLVRDLIALRRATPHLRTGAYATLPAPDGAWAYTRGDAIGVALNLSSAPVRAAGLPEGRVAVSTGRARDGEATGAAVALAPWEGLVVELSAGGS